MMYKVTRESTIVFAMISSNDHIGRISPTYITGWSNGTDEDVDF